MKNTEGGLRRVALVHILLDGRKYTRKQLQDILRNKYGIEIPRKSMYAALNDVEMIFINFHRMKDSGKWYYWIERKNDD